jgi:3(or 17)beta-hydroxysteroid dehydrogenase
MTIPYFGGVDPKTLTIDANLQTRFAEPGDVANLVLFLVSDESRFINGAELHIDNAMTVTNF